MGWPMIRRKGSKLIWHASGEEVLYDLAADPGETKNLVEEHKALAGDLFAELYSALKRPRLELGPEPAVHPVPSRLLH
jgi:hypothetical protein